MTLLSVMMVLSVLALMGLGAARYALWGERLAQGERDLAVSFEAAEAALLDAEWDVMGLRSAAPGGATSQRHCDFVAAKFLANRASNAALCGQGAAVGVCLDAAHPGHAWRQATAWLQTEQGFGAQNRTVAYGQFTGAAWSALTQGGLVAPAQAPPPRYIIEWVPLLPADADPPRSGWVVTAVGFGLNPLTQTWLQVVLDKPGPAQQAPCATTSGGPQTPWQYQASVLPTAMPNRWRCQPLAGSGGDPIPPTATTPPGVAARICGRLSWRELSVGNAGFTLIELLVVLAIVGVLAALVYPGYLRHLSRAKSLRCQTEVMLAMQAQERFKSEQFSYRLLPASPVGESPVCLVGARACSQGGAGAGVGSVGLAGSGGTAGLKACIEVFAQPMEATGDWAEMRLDSQGRSACVQADGRVAPGCWQ